MSRYRYATGNIAGLLFIIGFFIFLASLLVFAVLEDEDKLTYNIECHLRDLLISGALIMAFVFLTMEYIDSKNRSDDIWR